MLTVVVFGAARGSTASDKSTSATAKAWERAKEDYTFTIEKLKDDILDDLDDLEAKARERGELDRVKKIVAERDAFEDENSFPPSIRPREFERALKAAQDQLRKSAKEAQKVMLVAREDEEAERVGTELEEVISSSIQTHPRRPWINESYGTTVRHVRGNQWADIDNKTGKLHLSYKETARGKDFLEVYCAERDQELRFLSNRAELKRNGKWEWVAHGHWASHATGPAKK